MDTLEHWHYAALAAALLIPALALISAIRRAKRRRDRDFTRRLETVLRPKEEIKAVCPGKDGHWIATNERLLIEQGEAFFAVPFDRVKKISGVDENGKAVTAAGKMETVTVKADADHVLRRRGEAFTDLVRALKAGLARARRKSGNARKKAPAKEKTKAAAKK